MQTERVTFLTTAERKAAIADRAAARGISLGEYIRRKVEDEDELTPEQEAELSALVEEVNETVPKMAESLDRMSRKLRETSEDVRRTLASLSVRR